MEKFVNSSEYERKQAREHARVIAYALFLAAFAMAGLWLSPANSYTWLIFWQSVLIGLVAYGIVYAVVYIVALPSEPGDWNDVEEREIVDTPPLSDNPTRHEFTAVWDGRLRVGNRLITIPDDVGEDNIKHMAAMRRRLELETVSLRALDSIGISRHATKPPNARSVLDFLSRAGLVDADGNWTAQGLLAFPPPSLSTQQNRAAHSTNATTAATGGVSRQGVT